jgi:hypothetical protein
MRLLLDVDYAMKDMTLAKAATLFASQRHESRFDHAK